MFYRKWIWKPSQLTWFAGLSWWHEQKYASQVSPANEPGHEQP